MSLDYINLFSTIIPAFLIIYLGILVYFHGRKSATNILFSLISLSTLLWSIANYISVTTQGDGILFWTRMVLFFAVPHAILFLAFIYNFPQKQIVSKGFLLLLLVVMVPTMTATVSPYVFSSIDISSGKVLPQPGSLMPLFAIVVLVSLLFGLFIITKKYIYAKDQEKTQWRMMLIGTCLSYALIILTNFVLVVFYQNTSFIRFGPLFMIPTILGMGYAVLRYKLLDIKAVATEILTLIILSISMFDVYLAKTNSEMVLKIVLFIFYLTFGVLIIRSVLKEVSQREKIEKLALELEKTNTELETVNAKLKELDKQKTEFVSIASHQLRSPLTAIKGYSSMLLEGSFGKLSAKSREAVQIVFESSQKLVGVIEDFLNITRIELGKMKYEMSVLDMSKMVESTINELKPSISRRGLTISFSAEGGPFNILGDPSKLNQVFLNVIDNAIKYTEKGDIAVSISRRQEGGKNLIRFESKDTGVGIDADNLPKLFEKFIRADGAGKTNISGTGLGLFVAKQIVEAHNGKIWAESTGKGHGSTFVVELEEKKG